MRPSTWRPRTGATSRDQCANCRCGEVHSPPAPAAAGSPPRPDRLAAAPPPAPPDPQHRSPSANGKTVEAATDRGHVCFSRRRSRQGQASTKATFQPKPTLAPPAATDRVERQLAQPATRNAVAHVPGPRLTATAHPRSSPPTSSHPCGLGSSRSVLQQQTPLIGRIGGLCAARGRQHQQPQLLRAEQLQRSRIEARRGDNLVNTRRRGGHRIVTGLFAAITPPCEKGHSVRGA